MSLSPGTAAVGRSVRIAQLDEVLDRLADQIPGVAHVIAVSGDGLLIAMTGGLDDDRGDQLAAIVAGMTSLAASASRVLETKGVKYQMLAMADGTLVVQMVPDGSALAALAHPDCDWSHVAYELANLALRLGEHITSPPRPAG